MIKNRKVTLLFFCLSKMSFIISCAFSHSATIFSRFSFLVWGESITDCTSSRIFANAFWNLILDSLSSEELFLYASKQACQRRKNSYINYNNYMYIISTQFEGNTARYGQSFLNLISESTSLLQQSTNKYIRLWRKEGISCYMFFLFFLFFRWAGEYVCDVYSCHLVLQKGGRGEGAGWTFVFLTPPILFNCKTVEQNSTFTWIGSYK